MIKSLLTRTIPITIAGICLISLGGLGAHTASAAGPTTGAQSCGNGQQVTIVSKAAGLVTHSYAEGPEHLGYPIYRQNFKNGLVYTRVTKTSLQFVYWDVNVRRIPNGPAPVLRDAYAVCERP